MKHYQQQQRMLRQYRRAAAAAARSGKSGIGAIARCMRVNVATAKKYCELAGGTHK